MTHIFKQCKYSRDIITILTKNGDAFIYEGECSASTCIYTRVNKRYMRVIVTCPLFLIRLSDLMNDANEYLKYKLINEDQIIGKIPIHYGHITIPISNDSNQKIISSSITPEDELKVGLQATSLWINHNDKTYGINWLFHYIIKY